MGSRYGSSSDPTVLSAEFHADSVSTETEIRVGRLGELPEGFPEEERPAPGGGG